MNSATFWQSDPVMRYLLPVAVKILIGVKGYVVKKRNNVEDRLDNLINTSFEKNEINGIAPYVEHRIFTNRSIKMNRIEAVGFDMDYTLAQYDVEALDRLTMDRVLKILTQEHGYSTDILNIQLHPQFAIRGLVLDTQLGNVLKMDKFRYVSLAYHGLRPLASSLRSKHYNSSRINFQSGRYKSIDTLFALLETYLLAAIIELLENEQKQDVDYPVLYQHIRNAIDLCHRDGSLKAEIQKNPQIYIKDDPFLIPALHRFKDAGKRLFVVTNSEPDYTEFVLDYLFRQASPFFKGWRDCFEIVGCAAAKPTFFKGGTTKNIIEDDDCLFFSGGNIDFLEDRLGIRGDHILYVGDHIYGDILKSKRTSHWRTCIIVPELEFQIRAEREVEPLLNQLLDNENQRKEISMRLNWQRSNAIDLQQFKMAEADDLDGELLAKVDKRIKEINRELEKDHELFSKTLRESKSLRRNISERFNCFWGRLFKTGDQLSLLAEQIRDYACIYTSSVSNFNFYEPNNLFVSVATPMPHEPSLFPVEELDFDTSMEHQSDVTESPDLTGTPNP